MKKLLCLLICLSFVFTTGCGLFKSDEEKFDELTAKFVQTAKATESKEECEKIGEEYIESVPKAFKNKAKSKVISVIAMRGMDKFDGIKFTEGSSKIANYPE